MPATIRGIVDLLTPGWTTRTHKVMLMGKDFLPSRQHNTVSDIVADEYSGPGYSGGFSGTSRKTLATPTINEDDANQRAELDADNPTWPTGELTAGGSIGVCMPVWRPVTADSDSPVVGEFPMLLNEADVTAASEANPAQITSAAHGLATGDVVFLRGFAGGTWAANVNDRYFQITVVDANNFTLDGVNSTGFGTATFATAKVYKPLPMNGAAITPTFDAEGFCQFTAEVGE